MKPFFSIVLALFLALLSSVRAVYPLVLQPLFRQSSCPIVLKPDQPSTRTLRQYHSSNIARHPYQQRLSKRRFAKFPNLATPRTERILNGAIVTSKRIRELSVGIIIGNGNSAKVCSGALISSIWVLTAAHCNVDTSSSVVVGARSFSVSAGRFEDGKKNMVKKVINHPNFDADTPNLLANDIALIELASPVQRNSFLKVNRNRDEPENGSFSRLIGYGIPMFEGNSTLQQVDVPILPGSICQSMFKNALFFERQICAGYLAQNCGSCIGDDGGPLIQYDNEDNPVLVGIISGYVPCKDGGKPIIAVRVDAFIEWMGENRASFTRESDLNAVFAEGSIRDSKDGISTGLIAGIVAGVLAAVILIIGIPCCLKHRRLRKNAAKSLTNKDSDATTPLPGYSTEPSASDLSDRLPKTDEYPKVQGDETPPIDKYHPSASPMTPMSPMEPLPPAIISPSLKR